MSDMLSIWTLYDHPRDAPESFVARRFAITGGNSFPTDEIYLSETLEPLRAMMAEKGLVCMPRQEGDDPVIIESWI